MATGGGLIGALRVTLGLDSSQFEAGSKRARQIAKRDVSEIQKTLKGVTSAFKGMLAITAATGLVSAASRALDYASSLAEIAQQLGITTRDLQVYRYVASQVGIEQDEMDKGLQKLTKSIGEAAVGVKKPAAAFRELGVSVQDSSGQLLTAGEVIPRLSDALSKIEEPAKRARLETALFGKTGQQLDTMLTEGARGIQAYADEAERLGLIMGDDLIQKADAAADRLAVLGKVLEVQLASAVAENAEGVLVFANAFISLVGAIGESLVWLRKFGQGARQAINVAQGWTVTGERASGEAGYRARARYFSDGVAADEEERRLKEMGKTARNAKLREPGDLPTPSGGGGRKRAAQKDRSAEYEARYLDQLARARVENLDAYAELTGSFEEEYTARMAALAADRAAFDREIKLDEHLDTAKRAQLTAERDRYDELQEQLIEEQRSSEVAKRVHAVEKAQIEALEEVARYQLEITRTASGRREVELNLLELKKREERAQLELVLATEKTSSEAWQRAHGDMETLDARYDRQADLVRRSTMGPMEGYLDSLPKTADDISESFERIRVDGLQSLTDGFAEAITGARSLGDVFKSVTNQIIADIARIMIQKAIANGLSSALGGLFGGGDGGGIAGMGHESGGHLPGFAGGGSFMVGGNPGIDRNVLAINGIPRARVSANENIKVGFGGAGGAGPIVIQMEEGALFRPVVRREAAGVSIQTTRANNSASNRRSRQRLA